MLNETPSPTSRGCGILQWVLTLFIAVNMSLVASKSAASPYTHDQIIGFSDDGRYFAYETFGLQRGSGLPFANIFVVDLDRDAWVSGSPFRSSPGEEAMAEVEAAPYAALASTRQEARRSADPMLHDLRIRRPATVLYAAGIGQAHEADELTRIDIPNPDNPTAAPSDSFSLLLESFPAPGGADYCFEPEVLRGFSLVLQNTGAPAQTLHRDQSIPASRGCPATYRLDAVVSAGYPQPDSVFVAMVSVWRQGFEGLQRHVIALPVPLHQSKSPAAQSTPNMTLAMLTEDFLSGMQTERPASLVKQMRAGLDDNPSSVFWPDADLSPATRATELIAAQSGYSPHGRLWIQEEQVEIVPEGAGGPMTVSLITAQIYNLGEVVRAELIESIGSEHVAPPSAFGTGANVEWRFVMRPVQGMRADLVAAGRQEIGSPGEMFCARAPCLSPNPLDLQAEPRPCRDAAQNAAPTGVATSLGALMASLEGTAGTGAWLAEFGLWQDDAVQVAALADGRIIACAMHTTSPD